MQLSSWLLQSYPCFLNSPRLPGSSYQNRKSVLGVEWRGCKGQMPPTHWPRHNRDQSRELISCSEPQERFLTFTKGRNEKDICKNKQKDRLGPSGYWETSVHSLDQVAIVLPLVPLFITRGQSTLNTSVLGGLELLDWKIDVKTVWKGIWALSKHLYYYDEQYCYSYDPVIVITCNRPLTLQYETPVFPS